MRREDVREYVERPWAAIGASRRAYHVRQYQEQGPRYTLALAHTLWLHMRALRPDWPTEAERAEDLAHHRELRRLLDQAGRALAGR